MKQSTKCSVTIKELKKRFFRENVGINKYLVLHLKTDPVCACLCRPQERFVRSTFLSRGSERVSHNLLKICFVPLI